MCTRDDLDSMIGHTKLGRSSHTQCSAELGSVGAAYHAEAEDHRWPSSAASNAPQNKLWDFSVDRGPRSHGARTRTKGESGPVDYRGLGWRVLPQMESNGDQISVK